MAISNEINNSKETIPVYSGNSLIDIELHMYSGDKVMFRFLKDSLSTNFACSHYRVQVGIDQD